MVQKSIIESNFNHASKSYDSVAKVQRFAAQFLIHKIMQIRDLQPKTVLDLGAGTGYISELLLPIFPESFYIINDIAKNMLSVCKNKFSMHKNFSFIHSDMMSLNVKKCDLIVSNLAMQWLPNIHSAIEYFEEKTSQVFGFSTLLDGTFNEWQSLLSRYSNIQIHNYITEENLRKYCEQKQYTCWSWDIPLLFDTPIQFMRYLKQLGASTSNQSISLKQLRLILRENNRSITTTYRIFFAIKVKL